jgi:hypothetical protein
LAANKGHWEKKYRKEALTHSMVKEDTKLGLILLGIALTFNFCAFTVLGSCLKFVGRMIFGSSKSIKPGR